MLNYLLNTGGRKLFMLIFPHPHKLLKSPEIYVHWLLAGCIGTDNNLGYVYSGQIQYFENFKHWYN